MFKENLKNCILGTIDSSIAQLELLKTFTLESTPHECVLRNDVIALYRYTPIVQQQLTRPLLIIFSQINRPYILDITQQCSFIQKLLAQGIVVYLLEWQENNEKNLPLLMHDYITIHIKQSVDYIKKNHRLRKINLLGICQGGLYSLVYSALYQHSIKNLLLAGTPIDFHTTDSTISNLIKHIDFNLMAQLYPIIPGLLVTKFFIGLRPFTLLGKKYLKFIQQNANEAQLQRFLSVEKWIYDNPDQAGSIFYEFINKFYLQNSLFEGSLTVGQQKINLENLTMPILNIASENDSIVPLSSTIALKKLISPSKYYEHVVSEGHIGMFIQSRKQDKLSLHISNWLKQHD